MRPDNIFTIDRAVKQGDRKPDMWVYSAKINSGQRGDAWRLIFALLPTLPNLLRCTNDLGTKDINDSSAACAFPFLTFNSVFLIF